MTPDEAHAWLDAHVNLESIGVPRGVDRRATAPTLDRIRSLIELLGSPQRAYPSIHVTGTNGKTSTTRLTAELLIAQGLSVGSFTSPHLERVNERVAWNGNPIGDGEFARLMSAVADIEPHVADKPSYFEVVTAAGLTWFADVAVDVGVVEVGLGGTWDATNVIDGRVCVITNVSIDHVEYLGPTRHDIASEKAGIVKPGSTLVLGETDPELVPLFLDRRPERVLTRGVDFGVRTDCPAHGGRLLDVFTPGAEYERLFLSLHGAHQADNAATALAAAEGFLETALPHDLVAGTFAQARSPGRLEVVGHRPLVLLDGAHNVAGARALRTALAEEFPDLPRTLVVGLLRQKEPHEMLEALGAMEAARVVCCRPPSPRALDPREVAAAATDLGISRGRVEAVEGVEEAVARALEATAPEEQIVVTGTLYLVGAARHAFVSAL